MLRVAGVPDEDVYVGIRPEGFVPDERGPLTCALSRVEVMGRDNSIIAENDACVSGQVRAIISSVRKIDKNAETVRFALLPEKVHLFSKETEERIRFRE